MLKILLPFLIVVVIATTGSSQELSLQETLDYIANKCINELVEQRSIPGNQEKGKLVSNYVVTLEFDYLIVKTVLKDGQFSIKKAKLKDATISYKFVKGRLFENINVQTFDTYQIYIGDQGLPALDFSRIEDVQKIIKALKYLQTFCKPDPFSN
jgi:hypothetical protein